MTVIGILGLRVMIRGLRHFDIEASFSQEGEDRILNRLFETQRAGFFIDVGAHHPIRFSNTMLLYLRGWRGVNLDPTPGSMKPFRRWRPRDTNLEVAVGRNVGVSPFFQFREPALNTFDRQLAAEREAAGWVLDGEVAISRRRLSDVWDEVVPGGMLVDLLTIDVEGLDLDVLESLDWDRHRPRVICVEELDVEGELGAISRYLKARGYRTVGRTAHTHLYRLERDG
jgi:FkbM family methyltransferase